MIYDSKKTWSLQQKLFGACFCFLAVLLVFGAWFALSLWKLAKDADPASGFSREIAYAQSALALNNALIGTLRVEIESDSPLLSEHYAQTRAQLQSLFSSELAHGDGSALDSLVQEAQQSRQHIDSLDESVQDRVAANDRPGALSIMGGESYLESQEDFGTAIADYLALAESVRESEAKAQQDDLYVLFAAFSIFLCAFLVAGSWVASAVSRSVVSSIRELQEAASAIGKGDFSHRVPVSSKDEIGDLATAINKIRMVMAEDEERGGPLKGRLKDITTKIGQSA